jgi:hypothetical protein
MLDAIQTTDGISALRMIIQVTTLILVSFAGGVGMGRFLYARALEQKEAEIANKNAEISNVSSRSVMLLEKLDRHANLIMLHSDISEYNRHLPTSMFKGKQVLPASLQLIIDDKGDHRLKMIGRGRASELDPINKCES